MDHCIQNWVGALDLRLFSGVSAWDCRGYPPSLHPCVCVCVDCGLLFCCILSEPVGAPATGPPLGQSWLVVALILSFLSPQLPVLKRLMCSEQVCLLVFVSLAL